MLLCVSIAHAQDAYLDKIQNLSTQNLNKLLIANDFEKSDGRMVVTDVQCQINNGDSTHKFVVSVVCLQNAFNEIGLEKINEIIVFANDKAKATISMEHNYVPTEIRMAYNPAIKDWSLTNLFSTKDKDGNTNSKLLAMDFDATGRFIKMKKIF